MSYISEKDALLPKTEQASDVNNTRPFSMKSFYDREADIADNEGEDEDDFDPKRHLVNDIMALVFGVAMLFCILFIFLPDGFMGDHRKSETIEQRVYRILTDTPLIDGHNDLAILVRVYFNNELYDDKFKKPFENGGMPAHVDLPRLRQGMNGGAFWSAFVPCPKNGSDFSDANYFDSVAFTLTQIDVLTRLTTAYPNDFSSPLINSSTALQAFKSHHLISPIIIEGLHQISNKLSNLRHYHSLGVRYATLTHNCHNPYADAALLEVPGGGVKVAPPHHNGISPAGQDLIHEMNRLGMIVDLSHTSPSTMRDVLSGKDTWSGSAAPIMFSHSSAYAICPHPRNVPDDVLHLVKKKRGIVMVNFSPEFISCVANEGNENGIPDYYPKNNTLGQVADHVMYIGNLIGWDHVGFGSDFDGISSVPEGLEDVSKYPDLVGELLRRGVRDRDMSKVVGGNILRVWEEVDAAALKMQKDGVKPVEDKLESLFGEMNEGAGLYDF